MRLGATVREQAGNDPQILSKVVTRDETWCYGFNQETKQASNQWKTPNTPKAKKVRQVRSNVKFILISFLVLMELCTRICSSWIDCESAILFEGVEKIMR